MGDAGVFPSWLSHVSFAGRRTNTYKRVEEVLKRHGVVTISWGGQVKAERPDAVFVDDATCAHPPKKVETAVGFGIPVIKVEWVTRCDEEGRMLPYGPFKWTPDPTPPEEKKAEAPAKPAVRKLVQRRRARVLDESSSETSSSSSSPASSEGDVTMKSSLSSSMSSLDIEEARAVCAADPLRALKFACEEDAEAERLFAIRRRAQARKSCAQSDRKRSRSQFEAAPAPARGRLSVPALKKPAEADARVGDAPADPWGQPWWERSKGGAKNRPAWGSTLAGEARPAARGRASLGRPVRPVPAEKKEKEKEKEKEKDKEKAPEREATSPAKKRRRPTPAAAPSALSAAGSSSSGAAKSNPESPVLRAGAFPLKVDPAPQQEASGAASLAARRRMFKERKLQQQDAGPKPEEVVVAAPTKKKPAPEKAPEKNNTPPVPPLEPAAPAQAPPSLVKSVQSPLSPPRPQGRQFEQRAPAQPEAAPKRLLRTGRPSVGPEKTHVDKAAEKRKKGGKDYERPWLNGAKGAKKNDEEPQVDHIMKTLKEHKLTKDLPQDLVAALRNEILDPQQMRDNGITFDDVQGLEEAKKTLNRSVILPRTNPKLFRGLRQPAKGLLLFGPPGNGKTMLAKAVAAQCNLTFFNISASVLTSKMVGDGEKNVKALFACARALSPSFVFLDEIDSLLTSRGGGGTEHESSRRLKTEFLVQLDGAGAQNDGVLVMAATNRPMDLDDAVLRRLEKRVFVPLPNKATRLRYCQRTLMKDETDGMVNVNFDDHTWDVLAGSTENYSFCDLSNLCRELALAPLDDCEDLEHADADDLRPINIDDVHRQIQKIRESVSQDLLKQLVKWNETFGSKSQV